MSTAGVISGWAFDPDTATSSITVKAYFNGASSTGQLIGTMTANAVRADVNSAYGVTGNHGFTWQIPMQYRQTGGVVYLYALDSTTGSLTLLPGSPRLLASLNLSPRGAVGGLTATGTLSGWAFDPDAATTSLSVQIYADGLSGVGTLVGTVVASTTRADVNTAFGITGNHGFTWQMPDSYRGASHAWYVYAQDASSTYPAALLSGSGLVSTTTPIASTTTPPTLGTPTLVSTISGGSLVATSSPALTYLRGHVKVAGSMYPDNLFVTQDNVTSLYSASQFAIETNFTGTQIELIVKGNGSSLRWWVDGQIATLATTTKIDGNIYYVKLSFPSRGTHDIVLEGGNGFNFGGFNIGSGDSVAPTQAVVGPRAIFLGDSFTEPTGSTYSFTGWAQESAETLGWDGWQSGSGSTGYSTNGGITGRYKFSDRLQDVTNYNPAIVVVEGGVNDLGNLTSMGTTTFDTYVDAALGGIRSGVPGLQRLVVIGPFRPNGNPDPIFDAMDTELSREAAKYNALFISTKGWLYTVSDGTHPNQAGHDYIAQKFVQAYQTLVGQ